MPPDATTDAERALHPTTQRLLERMNRSSSALDLATLPAARSAFETQCTASFDEIADAHIVDSTIATAGRSIPVRVYRTTAEADGPALAYFHGGGFVMGSIQSHDPLCRALAAKTGTTVVSIGYRLAPEHRFPAAHDDAVDAFAWLISGASGLDIDVGRVGVAGDSAGGALAASISTHPAFEGRVRIQALFYPVLDFTRALSGSSPYANGYGLDADLVEFCYSQYLGGSDGPPPMTALAPEQLRQTPPTLLVVGSHDPLCHESGVYAARLREAGRAVDHLVVEGMIHGFLSMPRVLVTSRDVLDDVTTRIRVAFKASDQ